MCLCRKCHLKNGGLLTLPETNSEFAPENRSLEDEMSFWDGPFSGTMLLYLLC